MSSPTGPRPDAAAPHPRERLDEAQRRIVLRPDGYHWISLDGQQEFGPFETWEAAAAALQTDDELAPAVGESLAEAESEIGVADWIDPTTGEPGEGACPPHVDEDGG